MKLGVAQMLVTSDKESNLAKMQWYVKQASEAGSRLLVFPEAAMRGFGRKPEPLSPVAEQLDGPFIREVAAACRSAGLWVVFGMFESVEASDKVYNTQAVIDPSGQLVAAYRKIHLFDAYGVKESDRFLPGDGSTVVFDCEGTTFGVMTCYDLRFPELARHLCLSGTDCLLAPVAWYHGLLKESHLAILARARAIENNVYLAVSSQVTHGFSGNSMVVDPMGVVSASLGEQEGLLVAEVSRERIGKVRRISPTLQNSRPYLYRRWYSKTASGPRDG